MGRHKTSLGGSLAFIACVGLSILVIGAVQNNTKNSTRQSTSSSTSVVTSTPTPRPTATPRPVSVRNGQVLQQSDYQDICSFKVQASALYNHYIYLQYKGTPKKTTTYRELKASASSPYVSDIVLYVEHGKEAEIKVPIGNYKLYYASGDTYFGKDLLFGDSTRFYASDDILDFYTDENYSYGHTITLTAVVGGNMDTDPISESQFPGR